MMSKKPADRFQSAGEIAGQLKSWLADRGRTIGGGTIEGRDEDRDGGVGSGVYTRFSLGMPSPSSGRPPSGSGRTMPVSDRDTKKLDDKSGPRGPEEEIGLAPLDEEDVLGAGRRPVPGKPATGSDKQVSPSDLATSSDVVSLGAKSGSKAGSGTGSSKVRSLIEEELTDPEVEQIKRKVAQRAQFNPLLPPNYTPPSSGGWIMWVAIGSAVLVVLAIIMFVAFGGGP
jgi:hypothetical protein